MKKASNSEGHHAWHHSENIVLRSIKLGRKGAMEPELAGEHVLIFVIGRCCAGLQVSAGGIGTPYISSASHDPVNQRPISWSLAESCKVEDIAGCLYLLHLR